MNPQDDSFNKTKLNDIPDNKELDLTGLSKLEQDEKLKEQLANEVKKQLANRPVNIEGKLDNIKPSTTSNTKENIPTPNQNVAPNILPSNNPTQTPSINRNEQPSFNKENPFINRGPNMGQDIPKMDNRETNPPRREVPSLNKADNTPNNKQDSSTSLEDNLEDNKDKFEDTLENLDEEVETLDENIDNNKEKKEEKKPEEVIYVKSEEKEILPSSYPAGGINMNTSNKTSQSKPRLNTPNNQDVIITGIPVMPNVEEQPKKDNKQDEEKDKDQQKKDDKDKKEAPKDKEETKEEQSKEENKKDDDNKKDREKEELEENQELVSLEVPPQEKPNQITPSNENIPITPSKKEDKQEEPKITDNSSYSTRNNKQKEKEDDDVSRASALAATAGMSTRTPRANRVPKQPSNSPSSTPRRDPSQNLNEKKLNRTKATSEATNKPKVPYKKNVARNLANKSARAKNNNNGSNTPKAGSGNLSDVSIKRKIKKKLLLLAIQLLPFVILFFILLFGMLVIFAAVVALLGDEDSSSGDSSQYSSATPQVCTYNIEGMDLEGIKVDILDCNSTEDNYTVTKSVDFDKYVIGVAVAEVGAEVNKELFKAQIIAARNFALTRGKSVCPDRPDTCYIGLNTSTKTIKIRGCSKDQQYCDYDGDCNLSETKKQEVLSWANEVKGQVLKDSAGNIVTTKYDQTDQSSWLNSANSGKTGPDIIKEYYEQSGTLSNGECRDGGSSSGSYATPTSISSYNLSTEGATILHEPLATFLSNHGSSITAFNSKLKANIDSAGYQTREGVVAAAVTLIGELYNNYKVKIPYYWSGGHRGAIELAKDDWGANTCHTKQFGNSYDYCGVDCSGFVAWAIYNGGFKYANHSNSFLSEKGAKEVKLSSSSAVVKPGDLLQSSGHVVMVVGIDESSREYIVAEATGLNYGVQFKRRKFNASGYVGVDLTEFYQIDKNKR